MKSHSEQPTAPLHKEDDVYPRQMTEAHLKEFLDAYLKDTSDFCVREKD